MSRNDGTINIDWRLEDDQKLRLSIGWEERSPRRTRAPRREGFGFRVIRSSIAGNLDGKADVAFTPEGVQWRLLFPLRSSEGAGDTTVH
jgi:two-component sensor histidine kinase